MIRKGDVSVCIGCGKKNLKDEEFVLKRNEQDWFPNENDDGTKSKTKSRHYHPKKECVLQRNFNYNACMVDFSGLPEITGHTRVILGDLGVTMS